MCSACVIKNYQPNRSWFLFFILQSNKVNEQSVAMCDKFKLNIIVDAFVWAFEVHTLEAMTFILSIFSISIIFVSICGEQEER